MPDIPLTRPQYTRRDADRCVSKLRQRGCTGCHVVPSGELWVVMGSPPQPAVFRPVYDEAFRLSMVALRQQYGLEWLPAAAWPLPT